MSHRTLIRLAGVAVALLVLWGVVSLATGDGGGRSGAGTDEWSGFFAALTPEAVTAVRIEGPEGSRMLTPEGEAWWVNGFPADSGTVARFWAALADTTPPELVARNPDNHARLGLVADSALQLVFATGADSLRLLLGRQGPARNTTYIRRPDSDAAYLSRRDLRSYAERSLEDWRDRRIVVIDTSRVNRVLVDRDDSRYALDRGDSVWTVSTEGSPSGAAEPGLVSSLLAGLAGAPAAGFAPDTVVVDTADARIRVRALSGEDDTLAVVRMGELDSEWWARVDGSEPTLLIPGFRAEQLAPPLEAWTSSP